MKDLGAQLWQAYKLRELGWQEFARTKELLTNWRAGGTLLREALDALRNGGKITDVITDLKAGSRSVPRSWKPPNSPRASAWRVPWRRR